MTIQANQLDGETSQRDDRVSQTTRQTTTYVDFPAQVD